MVERADIVKKCDEYLSYCLGLQRRQPLLIGATAEEMEVAQLFFDSRAYDGAQLEIENYSGAEHPFRVLQEVTRGGVFPLAVICEIQRRSTPFAVDDGNIDSWNELIERYGIQHAVGFIDRRQGELPWRIAFMGNNFGKQLIYGHGPGTTMQHMAGHFMIDYKEAARFGSSLKDALTNQEVVGYFVTSERGTNYVLLRDELTTWHNDLMPRLFKDPLTEKMIGDGGNIPGGELFEELTKARYIKELGTEIPIMLRRPAFGRWVADLSVGSAKVSLKESGDTVVLYSGVDPETMGLLSGKGGIVTAWNTSNDTVRAAMQAEIEGDPYVAEGLVTQEPLAFGYNPQADPMTDDLLEGEKAPALHIGFGAVLSHIDLLASLKGTSVYLVKGEGGLSEGEVQSLLTGKRSLPGRTLDKILTEGEYAF